MVLVAVRQDQSEHVLMVFLQVGEIRHHQVNAQ
jgi:hypothetical protein